MVLLNGFSAVLTVFIIGLLGYMLAKKKWITPEMSYVLPKFTIYFVIPPFLLRNVTTGFERDQLITLLSGSLVPLFSISASFLVGVLLAKLFRISPGRKGVFEAAFATSNSINIGLPINIALYGEASVPYVLVYFFGNLIFFWTVGQYCIAREGENGASAKVFSKATLKQIISPSLVGFLSGVVLVLLGWQLPSFLDKSLKYMGDMAVALGIIYVGVMLQDLKLTEIHLDKDLALVFLGRYIVAPIAVVLVALFLPVPDDMLKVFIIQASLPVMINIPILAGFYRADVRYATLLTSTTTLFSIITVPVIAFLTGLYLS